MVTLGVNVDHIATLRQARGGREPDPVHAAVLAELAGARGITAHLREDRRHIQDRDVYILKQTVTTHLNLEMAPTSEMMKIALDVLPYMVTIVPERREERTTEEGYPVQEKERELTEAIATLRENHILVSLFVNPVIRDVRSAAKIGATHIELYTGTYAKAASERGQTAAEEQLETLKGAAMAANRLNLRINAGHGLNYLNVTPVANIDNMEELNIGHSIIARASLVGIDSAVREMVALI
ncbi:MAG: pyridoxine 5'-phosphate synthase [Chitinispirillales bacterium]|jgi:pyridoxine 5-phosphate synthase|nr:pyridoxine 5'-phosphate synthase [Chitinispirillales bacterium]